MHILLTKEQAFIEIKDYLDEHRGETVNPDNAFQYYDELNKFLITIFNMAEK